MLQCRRKNDDGWYSKRGGIAFRVDGRKDGCSSPFYWKRALALLSRMMDSVLV